MSVEIRGETVVGEIEIDAPPEKVFEAFTNPAELAAWWGSPDTYRTRDWQVDLRPGGRWSCIAASTQGGPESEVRGEYTEVDPPRALAFTWAPSWEQGRVTQVKLTFEPIATGTRVRLVHWGFAEVKSAEAHRQGWTRVIGWLQQYCQKEIQK